MKCLDCCGYSVGCVWTDVDLVLFVVVRLSGMQWPKGATFLSVPCCGIALAASGLSRRPRPPVAHIFESARVDVQTVRSNIGARTGVSGNCPESVLIHSCKRTYVHLYAQAHTYTQTMDIHLCLHLRLHVQLHECIHIHIHTFTYTYM